MSRSSPRHYALSSRFGRCASHLDIGVAVLVDPEIALTVSDESEDVRWWPMDALPSEVPAQLEPRLTGLLWFEKSGHLCMFEEPGKFVVSLVSLALPHAGTT